MTLPTIDRLRDELVDVFSNRFCQLTFISKLLIYKEIIILEKYNYVQKSLTSNFLNTSIFKMSQGFNISQFNILRGYV